jgi:hypothetical protein
VKYKFNGAVLGVAGEARSGKDTVARIVQELKPHTEVMHFADVFKKVCQEVYSFSGDQLWGDKKDEPDARYPRPHEWQDAGAAHGVGCNRCGKQWDASLTDLCSYLTPREALQSIATWGRQCYPDIWIEYLFRRVAERLGSDRVVAKRETAEWGTSGCESSIIEWTDLVVVADVRMMAEAKAIKEAGGRVWFVHRPGAGLNGDASKHATETEVAALEKASLVDAVLHNEGTLDALRAAVQALL